MAENTSPFVRVALAEDRKDFYKLWKICFGDSDAFCDWFFSRRFVPEYSVCLEQEEILSCMQSFPYTFRIRGKQIPGAMLCGVSTHPDHRKKGYMGEIFRYEMNLLQQKGCLIAPHTPAVLESYFSFGHFPVADAAYLESQCVPFVPQSENLHTIEKQQWENLFPLYQEFAAKYSGIVDRTKEDFLRKCADYAADGGKCSAYIENNEIKGYGFYYQTETDLTCVEAVAKDGYYHALTEGLFALAEGCRFSAKLPPELYLSFPFAKLKKRQKGVMGLCNLSALMQALDMVFPYAFRVQDAVVGENNGCFDCKGDQSDEPPVFEISAGHLLQVLVGYRTLEELREHIRIFAEEKFAEIDGYLPKCHCYIIDEY